MKLVIVVILSLTLSGCSWFSFGPDEVDPVEVESRVRPIPVFHPPLPDPVPWMPVEWTVFNPELMQEYLDKVEAGDAPKNAYYCISPTGYENLSTNVAEIKRYIRDSNSLLDYYRKNLVELVVEQNTPKEKQPKEKDD